ncbi:MAG: metallophosphoesterase family protein [Acidobacteria bacterium]|nr:metallophosphoesterase family protein [Acidobacteriota bacterium]
MRIAIVSDIHGNGAAFEAVLRDLRDVAPDFVLHGGDLADGGSCPAEVVDRVHDLGWPGVLGNTDEMLVRPDSLDKFAGARPALAPLFDAVREMAAFTREALGEARLRWLRGQPHVHLEDALALVHATPSNLWQAPEPEAAGAELESAYALLGRSLVVYGHIHRPHIREMAGFTLANTGSAGLPLDGDPRASYLLIENGRPAIRRVEYDVESEIARLRDSRLPHAEWAARMLAAARAEMP